MRNLRFERTEGMRFRRKVAAALAVAVLVGGIGGTPVARAEVVNEDKSGEMAAWAGEIPSLLEAGPYEEGVVIVGIDPDVSVSEEKIGTPEVSEGSEEIMEIAAEHVDAAVEEQYDTAPEDAASETAEEPSDTVRIEMIREEGMSTEELLYSLAEDPRVVFAEPNYIVEVTDTGSGMESAIENVGDLSGVAEADEIADLTGLQWACTDEVAFSLKDQAGVSSVHVPGFGATGSNMEGDPIIVAVIDTPIDPTNQDLAPVIYRFTEEEQKALGCGEYGYNATWQSTDGQMEYWKDANHGVHCAGILGAAWDGHGVSGVASNVRIVSIQNHTNDGNTSLINALRAFAFVKKANEYGIPIRVTSNSFGLLQHSVALDAAVRELGEQYGVVSVFAAGNSNKDLGTITEMSGILGDNPYVIVVAATDVDEKRASFSNYGSSVVDLGAPGVDILSTVMRANSSYIADAVPTANVRYEGFEEASSDVSIRRVSLDAENGFVPWIDGEVTRTGADAPHFMGSFAGEIPFSMEGGEDTERYVQLHFGDVESAGSPLYVGFSFYTPNAATSVLLLEKDTDGKYQKIDGENVARCRGTNWCVTGAELGENADRKDLDVIAVFTSEIPSSDILYLDSVGVGTKRVPYTYLNGTSMATPLVAGAVALFAAKDRDLSGEELASEVKASIRAVTSMKGVTKSGGMLDLGGSYVGKAPVITEAVYEEGLITLGGYHFGDSVGRIRIIQRLVGQNGITLYDSSKDKEQAGLTWSDNSIKVAFEGSDAGIVQVMVENPDGRSGSRTLMTKPTAAVYETVLPLDTELGDLYQMEAPGDYDATGKLVGLEDRLYYLPTMTMVERQPFIKTMRVYDIASKTWSDAPELPEALADVSAAISGGKLYVAGASVDYSYGEVGSYNNNAKERIYCYDPATSRWRKCSVDGVSIYSSIVNCDGTLYVVGYWSVSVYDPEAGATDMVVEMPDGYVAPSVAAMNGEIYVYDALNYSFGVIRPETGTYTDLSDALPSIVTFQNGDPEENAATRKGTLVPSKEGILLVGPSSKSSPSDQVLSDTFLLKNGEKKFKAYPKRMSDAKVKVSVAATYRGWLYAIGSTSLDPGYTFFRATAMSVDEYPGDIPRREDTAVWKHNSRGWWLEYADGSYAASEWVKWKGTWYYFNADGYMAKNEWRDGWWLGKNGAQKYKGKGRWRHNRTGWWYEDSLGWYASDQWLKIDGDWYHFAKSGYIETGWKKIGEKWYFFNKDGIMQTGWKKYSGKWYYLGTDGAMVTSGTVRLPGEVTYEFDADGVCVNP